MRTNPRSRGRLAAGLLAALLVLPGGAQAQRMEFARAGAVSSLAAPIDTGSRVAPEAIRGQKSGFVAFGLGYLFPGAGHFYAGESWRGANIMGIVVGGIMMAASTENDTVAGNIALVSMGVYLWSMIDAPMAANRQNKRLRAQATATR